MKQRSKFLVARMQRKEKSKEYIKETCKVKKVEHLKEGWERGIKVKKCAKSKFECTAEEGKI
jgi:hypothetical protein